MTDLPEKIYQDGSTGQYRVTCEYCDKDFLGHKRDTTCTQCGEGYLDTVLENMARAMTMEWLAKRLRKSIRDYQLDIGYSTIKERGYASWEDVIQLSEHYPLLIMELAEMFGVQPMGMKHMILDRKVVWGNIAEVLKGLGCTYQWAELPVQEGL